ncbi:hypothetical protein [Paenibacillus lactis]|uniref:hypothetical protein n=1 Tax=Paenibacillus lactis TaxID=228574 RepID=UPI00368AD524
MIRKKGIKFKGFVFAMILGLTASISPVSAASSEEISNEENIALLQQLGYDFSEVRTLANSEDLKYAQLGYSKQELADITDVEKNHLDGIEGQLIAVDTKYTQINPDGTQFEITEEEYKNKQQMVQTSLCNVNTGCSDVEDTPNWMRLTTTVSAVSNTSPKEYLIRHSFQWLKKPTDTFKDAIGTGHHVNLTSVQDSEILTYNYDQEHSKNPIIGLGPWENQGTKTVYYWTADRKGSGMGFEVQLIGDSFNNSGQYKRSNHRGSLSYRVIKNNSSATAADVSGHYLHLTTQINGTLGIDIRGTGNFSISVTNKYTPAIQTGVSFSF